VLMYYVVEEVFNKALLDRLTISLYKSYISVDEVFNRVYSLLNSNLVRIVIKL